MIAKPPKMTANAAINRRNIIRCIAVPTSIRRLERQEPKVFGAPNAPSPPSTPLIQEAGATKVTRISLQIHDDVVGLCLNGYMAALSFAAGRAEFAALAGATSRQT